MFSSRKGALVLLALLSFSVCHGAFAETYYVATDGANTNNGSSGSPWASITHACSVLKPGDTVIVRDGVYDDAPYCCFPSGTSWSAPITIKAEHARAAWVKQISIQEGARYIIIDGLGVDASKQSPDASCVWTGITDYIRLANCEFKNAPSSGTNFNAAGGEVINCISHHNGDFNDRRGHGYSQASTDKQIVDGCTSYENANQGYDFSGQAGSHNTGIVLRNSVIQSNFVGIAFRRTSGALCYNNVIWGNAGGPGVIVTDSAETRIYNNTIYGNAGDGIMIPPSAPIRSVYLRNNIISDNKLAGIHVRPNADATAVLVENNILHQNSTADFIDENMPSVSTLNDNYVGCAYDPRFTNPSSNDFTLQSGSPAINYGQTLTEVPDDHAGATRNENTYDIGAYEYGSSATRAQPAPQP